MKRNPVLALLLFVSLGLVIGPGSRAEGDAWQPVSGPYGGSVSALALSPDYPADHTVFAGLRGQGVYRTINGGQSWQQVSPDGWVVVDLSISPAYADDGTIFASHGLWTSGYHVHRSSDEGISWQEVTPAWTGQPSPPHLAISPDLASDKTVYVVGGYQTFVSTDGGDTFVQAGGWFTGHNVTELAFSPAFAADQTLFALVPGEGLYKSTDGGTTWNLTGLAGDLSAFAISPDYANDQMLLAIGGAGQLYISTDGGHNWVPGALTLAPGGTHTLLFSPTFGSADRIILAASSADPGPYRSDDGGLTWTPVGWYDPGNPYSGFVGGSVYALALAPNNALDAAAFAGTSGGIYRSNSWGSYWSQSNTGLARLTVRTLAIAPGNPGTMLAGTSFFENQRSDVPHEDDGNLQLTTDGGQTWRNVSGRLERVQNIAFSPGFAADQTIFAATGTLGQHGCADGGVYRSTDGGLNWQELIADRICHALALSPRFASDHTLWIATSTYSSAEGIRVSTDGGDTWAPLAPGVHAQVLAPSPNYAEDHTLFAGTLDAGLQRSTNGGLNWTQVLSLPVTALAVSPAYGASRTVYAGVQELLTAGKLYRSTDGGDTWQQLETGIPPAVGDGLLTFSTLAFAADGSVLAGVYYGSEGGNGAVYRSTDGGESWQTVGSGLDDYNPFSLATVSGGSMTFYAGTDGGLWRLEVPQGGPAEPGTWESGELRGGRAQALAISPDFANDGVAFTGEWTPGRYADQWGLGIFKSTDGGQTWQASSSGIEGYSYSSAIHDYALSPAFAADGIAFVATWGGLFRSTDGGASWQWVSRLYSGPPGAITSVAVAPDYPTSGHVLAGGGYGGVHVSRDGGVHWTVDYSISSVTDIAYSPDFALDQTAFVGSFGLYKTTDDAVSWTKVLTEGVSAVVVSPQFMTDTTVFAGAGELYISHDGGTSWISVTLPTTPTIINALAISPDFGADQTLFAGINSGLYRSTDGGLTWERVPVFPALAVRSLAISPGWPAHPVLLVGTDQGVYRTTDGGATWALAQGLIPLSTTSLALSADESLLLAGSYRHGIHCSHDGGSSWSPLGLQEMWSYRIESLGISPDYAADRTIFAVAQNTMGMGGSVYRTTDGGATWESVGGTSYVGRLAISPHYSDDPAVFATGSPGGVFGSHDGGDTWELVGEWPPGVEPAVTTVALPANYPADGAVFAGGDGFWRLPAGETTWQLAASGLITDTRVSDIAVSPNYAADATLLATAWWYEAGWVPHYGLFRSTDGGVNWQAANTGLPDVGLGSVAFSPHYATDHTAYVTGGGKLYRSLDGGLNWTAIGSPPGTGAVQVLVDNQGDVYVGSGVGVWHYSTPVQDILINGGFEANSGWDLPNNRAAYSDRVVYDGTHSMRVGIDNGPNASAYSSARQVVTIPADAISATLQCYVYEVSGELAGVALSPPPSPDWAADQTDGCPGDAQYLLILEADGSPILERLFWERTNAQHWQFRAFDLTKYQGQTIMLHWGVCNDGEGGRTGMYVDNAALLVKRSAPAERQRLYLPLILKSYGGP